MKWLATVLCFIASVGLSDIIPADRLVEWSTNTCGIPGGIPVRTNIYKTLWPGDDIQGALNLCPIGQVVLLTNGTFNLAGQLSITRPITLRGLTNTLIRGSSAANSGIVNMSVSHSLKGFETIASGATKGSTQLILSSGDSGLKPGYHIYVTQINPSSTAFICPDGGHGAPNDFTRNSTTHHTSQLVEVTNVSGANTVIDFLPPLVWSFSEGATKQINYYTGGTDGVDGRGTNMIVWAGVEDLSIQNTSTSGDSGQSIVWFNRTAYCWMKNVTTIDCCDSHVRVDSSYRFEIRGNTMTNVLAACNTSSHGYCVLVYYASSGGLIEDNIVVNNRDFIKMQGGSSGNAVLYNYQTNAIEITLDPNLRKWTTHTGFAHSAHPLMNLFEGNITYTPDFDFYWGSGSHETLLRNWFKGPNYWANREGAAIKIEKKYSTNNVVGNVLGSLAVKNNPVWTNQSSVVKPNTSWGTVGQYATFLIGYYDDTHIDGSYDSDAQWANTIAAGNYDFVTLSTAWYNPSTPDTITNSYFYGDAKPLYFGTNTWPPFSPNPLRYSETAIPAGYRFVNHSNPPISVLTISPQNVVVTAPTNIQFYATNDLGSGVLTNVTASVTWTSDQPNGATMDPATNGLCHVVGFIKAIITANYSSQSAHASVEYQSPKFPVIDQLSAVLGDGIFEPDDYFSISFITRNCPPSTNIVQFRNECGVVTNKVLYITNSITPSTNCSTPFRDTAYVYPPGPLAEPLSQFRVIAIYPNGNTTVSPWFRLTSACGSFLYNPQLAGGAYTYYTAIRLMGNNIIVTH